ncbi:hypothetical protein E3N88_05662 [Mikania micrantha]|uniref:Protein kinase domain-containing protein n=1 Tax=Mikania micrantha TaxID=192012 RepID=A0A5N6PMA5_9ASTR|nr:hypothetical protein E3N88_05662 [Mikania micrantha]
MCDLLDCHKRYKIILDVANILVYLHKHATIHIIHGDVKPANILLDESFNPKLSGFGLATAIDNSYDYIHVDILRGTLGYMAPEYLWASKLSTKAEVFSFGVMVLETATGQRIFDFTRDGNPYLFDYVKRSWLEGRSSGIIDPRVDVNSMLMRKLVEIGLLCVEENAEVRPTMEEVVGMLLGTISQTLPVSKMRARMNGEPPTNLDSTVYEDSDTTTVDEFISELCPR